MNLNFKEYVESTVYLHDELTKRGYKSNGPLKMDKQIYTNGVYSVELTRDAARNNYWLFYRNGMKQDEFRGYPSDWNRLFSYIDRTNQGIDIFNEE